MSHILVLGATGNIGRALTQQLVNQGETVWAASRKGLPVNGAKGIAFDFLNPASFEPAFAGAKAAYVMIPAGYADHYGVLAPVIACAQTHQVKVVLQTALGVDADDKIPFRQVEKLLEIHTLPYVILRPNWFADNFHTFWKSGVESGQIRVPAGEGKTSFIDVRDIAASAVTALTSSEFDGQAFNLTGPEALGYAEAAQILSQVLGKTITYEHINEESFTQGLIKAGLQADYAQFVASIFYPVRVGWTAGVTSDVFTLTQQSPRSLKQYAHDHVSNWKA